MFCTQSVLKPHSKSPETRINTGFPSSIFLLKLRFEFVICHDFPTLFIKNTTFYTELSTMSPSSPNKNHHLPTTNLIHHHLDNRSPESQTTAASVLLFPRPNSISYRLPQTDMKHHQEFQLSSDTLLCNACSSHESSLQTRENRQRFPYNGIKLRAMKRS